MWMLWLMPFLQIVNLIVFYLVAMYHFWYGNVLLIGCFYVGLLGGGVYVHGYSRINKDLPVSVREFALSSASVADGLGIVMADIGGLFIQSCLYNVNGLDGAPVSCPL
jgi:battenin